MVCSFSNEKSDLIFSAFRCRTVQLLRGKHYQLGLAEIDVIFVQQNYSTACTNTRNCQDQILNVDQRSDISVYSLSTVATTYQLSVDAQGVIDQKNNMDGFASTVTVWTRN
jgi:hypothetical protein